jgi:hypothetical protein
MYRSGWVPYGEAVTCMACGEGVRSAKTDQITLYNIVTRQESFVQVASSSEDCCECQRFSGGVLCWGALLQPACAFVRPQSQAQG